MLAGLLDHTFGFVKGAPDLGATELLKLTHHTLGHDQERGVINQLIEGVPQVEAI